MPNDAVTIYLCRHARTWLNAANLLRGHLDPPLDEVGETEARQLADALSQLQVARVVSSPLLRARQTADLIASRTGHITIVDQRLIDRDYAEFTGTPPDDLRLKYGSIDAAPGVEPTSEVLGRARRSLDHQREIQPDGAIVMVSHDIVIRTLLSSLLPSHPDPKTITVHTASWSLLRSAPEGWHVEAINQTATATR